MKRIMNDVAVATLLHTMKPSEIVKIIDVDRNLYSSSEPWDNTSNESFVCNYTVDNILHDYRNTKIANAKIYSTAVNEGYLILVIDTKHEVY